MRHPSIDALVNEVLARVLGYTFLVLVVATCVALLAVGGFGLVRSRRRSRTLAA